MKPRRISLGAVIGEVLRLYRRHAVVLLVPAVALTALSPLMLIAPLALAGRAGEPSAVMASTLLTTAGVVVTLFLTVLYQGLVVELVRDVQDGGGDATVGTMVRGVTPVVGALFFMSLAVGLAVTAVTVPGLILTALGGLGVGLVPLVVPALFLLTIWAVAAPVIVIERAGPFAALGRSGQLVSDNGFPVLGALILTVLIGMATVVVDRVAPLEETAAQVANFVLSVLAAPLAGLVPAVLYFALVRARAERSVAADDPAAPRLA